MFFILQPAQNEEPDIDRLINEYSKGLMRLCYVYLKDYQLAEEAAWDTLLRAYRKYNSFRRESSEKTWLIRIAVNICKSYMRKSYMREKPDNEYISLAYTSQGFTDSTYSSEESIDLLNAVYSLPVKYKEVILLHYYQEFSVNQISKILHEKENTISVRLKRAREMLKYLYKEE